MSAAMSRAASLGLRQARASGANAPAALQGVPDDRLRFEVYRDDKVSVTSMLFCGGMWRWRLCAVDGAPVAMSTGYETEAACRAALSCVRQHAGTALLPQAAH